MRMGRLVRTNKLKKSFNFPLDENGKHCFGGGLRHSLHGKQLFNRRLPNGADRLEGAQQRPCARFADAFNLGQRADQRVFLCFCL